MEVIFETLIGLIWEVTLQVVGQALVELGFYSLGEALQTKKERNPLLTAIGYILWGAILGGLSLWVFPKSFIAKPEYRILNLFLTPIMAGYAMALIGRRRRKRGQDLIKLDSFSYGALFALSTALVRFFFTR